MELLCMNATNVKALPEKSPIFAIILITVPKKNEKENSISNEAKTW